MAKYRLVSNIFLCSLLLLMVVAKRNDKEERLLTAEDFVDSIKALREWMTTTMAELKSKSDTAVAKIVSAFESNISMNKYKRQINSMHERVKQKMETMIRDIELIEENMPTLEPVVSSTLNPPTTTPKIINPPWWGTDSPLPPKPDSFGIALDVTRIAPDEGITFNTKEKEMFDEVRLDTDNAYDATTGIFTAPSKGTYLAFLQMDSSDEMPSTFELIRKTEPSWFEPEPEKTILRVSSDMDHGFAFATVYLLKEDEMFIRPTSDMGDFTPNVEPGLNTRLSVYCINQIIPVVHAG